MSPDDTLKAVADFVQEKSWRERSEILRLGLSEMMDERNDLRQIILSLEKWRRDGRISNVSKNFGAAGALRNVSFDLERGKILGLVGDNGGSKTFIPLRDNTRSI